MAESHVEFQERSDGYRAIKRGPEGEEVFLGAVTTRDTVPSTPSDKNPFGATQYSERERARCTFHAGTGAVTFEDLEAILAHAPVAEQ